jgi:hypothetical protein
LQQASASVSVSASVHAMSTGLSDKEMLEIMGQGWDASKHREELYVLQDGVDVYTLAPITPGTFVIRGAVGDVDHRVEKQMAVGAARVATRCNVDRPLAEHAGVAVNPRGCLNYSIVDRSVNRSKGTVVHTAMSNVGGSTLDNLFPLASYAHPRHMCFPYLVPIARGMVTALPVVVDYFQEHGVGTRVGSTSWRVGETLDDMAHRLRLGDIIDGQTDVRQTRATAARRVTRFGATAAAVPVPVPVPAPAGAGAATDGLVLDPEGVPVDVAAFAEAEDARVASAARVRSGVRGRGPVRAVRRVRADTAPVVAAARLDAANALDARRRMLARAVLARPSVVVVPEE